MTLEDLLSQLTESDRQRVQTLTAQRPQLSVTALVRILKLDVEVTENE